MKKLILLSFVLTIFGLIIAGGAAEGKVTVVWWHHMPLDGAQGKLFKKYVKEFEAKNPDIEVVMESIPHKDYYTKLPTSIASGEAPDIFGLSYRQLNTYHENGVLSPMDKVAFTAAGVSSIDELKKKWAPGVLEAYQVGDNYYGLPFQFNIYAYVINTKHFKEAGLDPEKDYPKTWDEVYEVANKLVKKKGNRVVRQAMSFPFVHSAAWYMLELEPIMRELGGSILNEDQTECLVNSEVGIKAMQEIKKRFDLGVADKNIAATLDYYNEGFPKGEFSMIIGGNWGPPRWYKNFPNIAKEGDFKAIPYPTYKGKSTATSTTSWAWVVYSKSKKKAATWKLANYITSMPSRNIIETGDIIPRAGWSDTEGAKTIPQAEFWEEMLQYSKPLASFKKYPEVSEALKRAMQDILLSDKDIKKTLDAAKKEIDVVLKD